MICNQSSLNKKQTKQMSSEAKIRPGGLNDLVIGKGQDAQYKRGQEKPSMFEDLNP